MNTIGLIVRTEIFPNKKQELIAVLIDLIAHCRETESGMLQYDWYINDEESECIVVESYSDSEAILFHFDNYKPFAQRLAACRKVKEFSLLGNPNEALKARMAKVNPKTYSFLAGR